MQANKISLVVLENVSDFQQLSGVSGQASQLGADEPSNAATFDILEHPLGYGMLPLV
jgi:hypothetical protein